MHHLLDQPSHPKSWPQNKISQGETKQDVESGSHWFIIYKMYIYTYLYIYIHIVDNIIWSILLYNYTVIVVADKIDEILLFPGVFVGEGQWWCYIICMMKDPEHVWALTVRIFSIARKEHSLEGSSFLYSGRLKGISNQICMRFFPDIHGGPNVW